MTTYVSPQQTQKPSQAKVEGSTTRIGANMTIDGETKGNEDLHVDGTVKGQITCTSHVTVGRSGIIKANVRCGSISIQGEVQGNIESDGMVTIESSGRLIGDITSRTFVNEPGGFFEGYSHMVKDKPKQESPNIESKNQNQNQNQKKK